MTVLLDEAVRDLAEKYGTQQQTEEDPVYQQVEPETWEEICEIRRLLDQVDYLENLANLEQFKGNGEGRKTN